MEEGSEKNEKVNGLGRMLGNAAIWTWHSYCIHQLRARITVCMRPAQKSSWGGIVTPL